MSARACTCGYRDQHVVNDLADIPILDQMQPVHPNAPDFLPTRARKA